MASKQQDSDSNLNESGSPVYKTKWYDVSSFELFDWVGIIVFCSAVKQIFF